MARKKGDKTRSQSRQTAPSLKRRENFLPQRLLVILACEGKKTERLYFECFFKILKENLTLSPASCVIAPHQHTDPVGVLQDLANFKDFAGRTFKDYKHRWIIIDRDEERHKGGGHTAENFNEAIEKAGKSKPEIKVAWSNPCFELWYLLHFHFHNTAIDRSQIVQKLERAMKAKYDKSQPDMFGLLETHLPRAIKNARRLIDAAKATSGKLVPEKANPATTVHELAELLIGFI